MVVGVTDNELWKASNSVHCMHVKVDRDAIPEDSIWMHEFGELHCSKAGNLLVGG